MRPSIVAFVAAGAAALLFLIPLDFARSEDDPGLALFKKNGCNECHSITALKIAREEKKKAEGDTTAAVEGTPATGEKKQKKEPPDLSGVGLEHEAKWISAFLNKQETKDGEKHEKRFKGTEAERRTIAIWLAGLKHEVKKAPTTEGAVEKK